MPPKSKPTTLDGIINQINQTQGPGTVIRGSEINWENHPRLPSGGFMLDLALGGGWPVNRWAEVYGEFCLHPDTQVLCADLTWRRLGDLSVGDEIVGFDEYLGEAGPGKKRTRYRKATVDSLGIKTLSSYRIKHDFGETVASEGHLWLVRTASKRVWRKTEDLRTGDHIVAFGEPWGFDESRDAGWLAGFYDGEGWVESSRVGVAQVPGPILDRTRELLERRGFTLATYAQSTKHSCKILRFTGGGLWDGWYQSLRFLGTVRPQRLLDKADMLWVDHATWRNKGSLATVESVTPVGPQEVVTIGTSTKTLVADGLLSHNSTGKTTLVLKTIAANQAVNPQFLTWWAAAEDFDPVLAKMCGCDLSRIVLHETNVMQEVFQQVIEVAETREVDCIVIDSYPALVPAEEDDGDIGDSLPGLGARLNGQFWRKQAPATRRSLVEDERPIIGFVINQPREKIGVMFGNPETTPGGRGKNFYYTTRVETRRGDYLNIGTKNDPQYVGQEIKATLIKNKSYKPRQVAIWDFYFEEVRDEETGEVLHPAGSYDLVKEVLDAAIAYGVIRSAGGGYYYGEEFTKGRAAMMDKLREGLIDPVAEEVMRLVHKGKPTEHQAPPRKAAAAKKAAKRG